jgi:hypothetical protein
MGATTLTGGDKGTNPRRYSLPSALVDQSIVVVSSTYSSPTRKVGADGTADGGYDHTFGSGHRAACLALNGYHGIVAPLVAANS